MYSSWVWRCFYTGMTISGDGLWEVKTSSVSSKKRTVTPAGLASKGGRSSDCPILRSRSRSSDFRLRSFQAFLEATQSLHRTSWGPKKRHNRFIAWNLFEGNELCRYIAAFGAPMKRHNRFIAWNLFKGNELCRYIAAFGAPMKRHNRFIAWNLFKGNELCRFIAFFGGPMKRHNRFIDFFKGNKRSVSLLAIFFFRIAPILVG